MDKEHLLNGYFENSLTEEERLLVEDLLKTDGEFLEEYTFRKDLKMAFQQNERKDLKEKLKKHEAEKNLIRFNWKYAAAAILVLGFGTYFLVTDFHDPKDLYSTYYETYPNTVSPIVRADPQEDSLENKAFQAYENKNFDEAILLFTHLYETNQEEYALFYKAMSFLESDGKIKEAIDLLQNTNWSKQYQEKSLWYLAMAYLKQKNESQAKEVLEKLDQQGNYREMQVKQLLEKL